MELSIYGHDLSAGRSSALWKIQYLAIFELKGDYFTQDRISQHNQHYCNDLDGIVGQGERRNELFHIFGRPQAYFHYGIFLSGIRKSRV